MGPNVPVLPGRGVSATWRRERGADLLLSHPGEALVKLGELAREVVVAAQGRQMRSLEYAVAATGELKIGDLLRLDHRQLYGRPGTVGTDGNGCMSGR